MLLAPASDASDAIQIEKLVASARRRALTVNATEHFCLFASIALGFFIVVLLLGTDIFPSVVFAVMAVALLAAWAWRIWANVKPAEVVAQIVDRKLALNDTISTAYFLLQSGNAAGVGPWSYLPVKQAIALASKVEPKQAFPLGGGRRWIALGALAAVAAGCFIARYAVTQNLSIRPPFLSLSIAPVLDRVGRALGTKEIAPLMAPKGERAKSASNANGKQATNNSAEQPDSQLPPPMQAKPDAASSKGAGTAAGDKNAGAKPEPGQTQNAAEGKSADKNDSAASSSAPGSTEQNPGQPNAAETSAQASKNDANAAKGQTNSSPSLMSRMKDAMSSMMSKLNPQTGGQKSPNAGDPSSQAGQQGQQSAKAGEQASSQQGNEGKDKANSEESASGQGDGQTSEKAGGKQGQSSSTSQQKGADSQSGVGKQDGDKSLRDAEQQQAMGKLAEILGKRSENLTGEMTVETPSGNQQLKTAYSQQKGKHMDSSSEINRNEVPARYQKYVREYMEQVQRSPAGKQ